MNRSLVRGISIALSLLCSADAGTAAPVAQFSPAQSDYILACAGCHGLNGVSNSMLVPSLKGLVGYYLNMPEGRAYLPRLPNVAFSTLNDEQLAAVLNYMVFDIGADSAPAGSRRTMRPRSANGAGNRSPR